MNNDFSTYELILLIILTLMLILWLIPSFFNQLKKIWYLKHNKDSYSIGMFYNAEKGKIESDQSPLH